MGVASREPGICPGCKKPVRRATEPAADGTPDPYPFCSYRCQMIDLGRWLDEEYRIPDGEDQPGGGTDGSTDDDGV